MYVRAPKHYGCAQPSEPKKKLNFKKKSDSEKNQEKKTQNGSPGRQDLVIRNVPGSGGRPFAFFFLKIFFSFQKKKYCCAQPSGAI